MVLRIVGDNDLVTFDQMLDGPQPPAEAEPPQRRRVSVVTVIGLVLILAGLGAFGWVGYQYLGTNVVSERQFDQGKQDLRETWDKPAPTTGSGDAANDGASNDRDAMNAALPGEAIALLRVPSWGDDYEIPVLKGTDLSILAKGVGVYSSSVAPGEIGNFAIAGHRITHGQPFSRLLELKPGDKIVVETRSHIYTYVMDNSPADLTVDDSASWVLDPVPGKPRAKPSKALITLTTCQDLFHSPDRSIGFGHLDSTVNK